MSRDDVLGAWRCLVFSRSKTLTQSSCKAKKRLLVSEACNSVLTSGNKQRINKGEKKVKDNCLTCAKMLNAKCQAKLTRPHRKVESHWLSKRHVENINLLHEVTITVRFFLTND